MTKEAGVSDVHIKMLGCWKSDTYQLYAQTPREHLARLSRQLATVGKAVKSIIASKIATVTAAVV